MTWCLRRSWHGAHPRQCTTRSFSIPPRRKGSALRRRPSCANGSSQSWDTTCVNCLAPSRYGSAFCVSEAKTRNFIEDLDGLRASSLRMSRMIEQILDFTRTRLGGGLELAFVPMDLREALTRIVDEFREQRIPRRRFSCSALRLRCAWARSPPRAGVFQPDRQCARPRRSGQAGLRNRGRRRPPRVGGSAQRRPTHSARASVRVPLQPVPQGASARAGARRGSAWVSTSRTEVVLRHGGHIYIRSTAAAGTTFRVVLPHQAVSDSGGQGG